MKKLKVMILVIIFFTVVISIIFTFYAATVNEDKMYLKNSLIISDHISREIRDLNHSIEWKAVLFPGSDSSYKIQSDELNKISDSLCNRLQTYIEEVQTSDKIWNDKFYFIQTGQRSFFRRFLKSGNNKKEFNDFLQNCQSAYDKIAGKENPLRTAFDQNVNFIINSRQKNTNYEYLCLLNELIIEIRDFQKNVLNGIQEKKTFSLYKITSYTTVEKPVCKQYEPLKAFIGLIEYEKDFSPGYFIDGKPITKTNGEATFNLNTSKTGINTIKIGVKNKNAGVEYSTEYSYFVY